MSQFRVVLCSDMPLYAQGLSAAFEENYIFKVVAQVNYEELTDTAVSLQPDVAIIKLRNMNALDLLLELKHYCPSLLQVAIVDDPGQFDVMEMVNSGVRGCLPARLLPRQVVNSVELIVVAGLLCLPRINPRGSLNGNGARDKTIETAETLTSREREVLNLLGRSYSNQEIAESLCLSESTIKTHLRNVFRKLRVRNRSEAIALLYGSEIIKYEQMA